LADYCNLSVRQLQRQFDDATGVSPKTLARTIRFEAIRNREFAAEMQKFQEMFRDHDNVVFLQSPPTVVDYTESELKNIGGLQNDEE